MNGCPHFFMNNFIGIRNVGLASDVFLCIQNGILFNYYRGILFDYYLTSCPGQNRPVRQYVEKTQEDIPYISACVAPPILPAGKPSPPVRTDLPYLPAAIRCRHDPAGRSPSSPQSGPPLPIRSPSIPPTGCSKHSASRPLAGWSIPFAQDATRRRRY